MLLALLLASAPAALPGPLEAGWQSKPVCEKLSEDDQLRVLRCTFAPGVGHDRHRHPRHWGYALSGGKMRITDAKGIRTAEIKAGSSFSSAGIEWHEVLNVGDTIVQYLIIEPR